MGLTVYWLNIRCGLAFSLFCCLPIWRTLFQLNMTLFQLYSMPLEVYGGKLGS